MSKKDEYKYQATVTFSTIDDVDAAEIGRILAEFVKDWTSTKSGVQVCITTYTGKARAAGKLVCIVDETGTLRCSK